MNRYSETERLGVNAVEKIFLKLGWIPRQIFQSDVGIDMEVEICEKGNPTGQLIGVQIKSGKSYFNELMVGDVIYRGKLVHLKYWLNHSLPIIIILYNPETEQTIWQAIVEKNISRTKTSWKIEIPISNELTRKSIEEIKELNKLPLYFQRLQRLSIHKELMLSLQREKRIVIEIEEWINKTIGRVSISLKRIKNNGDEVVLSEGTYIHFHGVNSLEILYPWAEFTADEDYYYEAEHDDFLSEYGYWDSEDNKYIGSAIDFSEYRSNLPSIRAIEDGSGETQFYRLELSLNSLAISFLEVNKYLEFDQQLKLNI